MIRHGSYELRDMIFNAEMALCDLRAFASGGSDVVDERTARQRAADLRAQADKIEAHVERRNGQAQELLSR